MRLILDNNIFFSLLNPFSINSYLFSSINAEFCAPEFIKQELEEHKEECLAKSGLSEHEFEIRQKEIEESIKFFKFFEFKEFFKEAINSLEDLEDSPYLALALSRNSAIWSNDKHLKKQSLSKVFSTEELVKMLLTREI